MTSHPQPRPWWHEDPGVRPCPRCGCPVQDGPVGDGMVKHYEVVHPVAEE